MKKLITTLVLSLSALSASAEFYTGNDLLERMNSNNNSNQMLAMGYVAGTFDMTQGEHHCAPVSITLGQVYDIAHKYIQNNPAIRHLAASVLVTVSLNVVWPCAEKKGSTL
jgi:hypothetical protein